MIGILASEECLCHLFGNAFLFIERCRNLLFAREVKHLHCFCFCFLNCLCFSVPLSFLDPQISFSQHDLIQPGYDCCLHSHSSNSTVKPDEIQWQRYVVWNTFQADRLVTSVQLYRNNMHFFYIFSSVFILNVKMSGRGGKTLNLNYMKSNKLWLQCIKQS